MGVSFTTTAIFALLVLLVFFLLFAVFWFSWRYSRRRTALSPYSGMPLRRGSDLSYYSVEKILRYLYELEDANNKMFDLQTAAVCRETGRLFPDSISWFDVINVDWSFLQKRRRGQYVSWGSLTPDQKEYVRSIHESLEDFQTEASSKNPLPKAIEPKYALASPGPLYVDIDSYVLLGWKNVPGTDFEVLIVQFPTKTKRTYFTPLPEESL